MSKFLISLLVLVFANIGFAASEKVQSQIDYPNPNGCRAFDMVLDPACPSDLASSQCEDSLQVIKDLNSQLKIKSLKTSCKRLHTGDVFARILEESLENSPSSDGYTLAAQIKANDTVGGNSAVSKTNNEETCQQVSRVLTALRLSASCDQLSVTVSK
jgi:hypothetical protein